MIPRWIFELMAEERARQCSTSSMLDGLTRDLSRGAIGYSPTASRYRDLNSGKFVSSEYKHKYCQGISLQRALQSGELSTRLNN